MVSGSQLELDSQASQWLAQHHFLRTHSLVKLVFITISNSNLLLSFKNKKTNKNHTIL